MIEITKPEKFIELFFSSDDSCYEMEFENSRDRSDGAIEIDFRISQAPRDLDDLVSFEEEEVTIEEIHIEPLDSDDRCSSIFKMNIPELRQKTIERLNLKADEPVSIVMYGDCSAGEYCDDETDAYLSGTLVVCSKGASFEQYKKESDEFLCKNINDNSATVIGRAIQQLQSLPKYGGEISYDTIQKIVTLNRLSVS